MNVSIMSEVSTTSSHANVPTTPTCFSDLPSEIRCQIWRASFPRRRVNIREGTNIRLGDTVGFSSKRVRTLTAPHPVAAFVNQESRAETLRFYCRLYQQFDSHEDEKDERDLSIPNTIYINPRLDTLFLTMAALTIWKDFETDLVNDYLDKLFLDHRTCNPRCIEAVEELEIYCCNQEVWWYYVFVFVKFQIFTNLKRLILVRHSSTDRSTDLDYIEAVKSVYETTDASAEEQAVWKVPEVMVRVDDCAEDLPKVEYSAIQEDSIILGFGLMELR
jgi:hypothetical protein